MVQIDTVLIKIASRCNINCSYCYVYNLGDASWARMPKLISDETIHATARGDVPISVEKGEAGIVGL